MEKLFPRRSVIKQRRFRATPAELMDVYRGFGRGIGEGIHFPSLLPRDKVAVAFSPAKVSLSQRWSVYSAQLLIYGCLLKSEIQFHKVTNQPVP